MADKRFHSRSHPLTLSDIARLSGADLHSAVENPDLEIQDVAPLDQAGEAEISFLDNLKYIEAFSSSKAAACFIDEKHIDKAPAGMALLITKSPYKAYALTAQHFYPAPSITPGIHTAAAIHPQAKLGDDCQVEPGAVIEKGADIAQGSYIGANAVIGENVKIGQKCRIGAGASITHALIGDHVHIYPGVRIGQDGFGFAIDQDGHVKVPQLGRVIIEDHVEIGANTTVDRGAGPDTVIGQGTWIDNLVQIGHNVKIGKGCVIVSQVGISGSTVIDDFVMIGGQAGLAGHLQVGRGARIAAGSGIMRDIEPGGEVMGYPALPKTRFMRQIAYLNRVIGKKG